MNKLVNLMQVFLIFIPYIILFVLDKYIDLSFYAMCFSALVAILASSYFIAKFDDNDDDDSSKIRHSSGVTVAKKCGSCGRHVPSSSRSGERCPYCHAYWGAERTIHR